MGSRATPRSLAEATGLISFPSKFTRKFCALLTIAPAVKDNELSSIEVFKEMISYGPIANPT